MRTYGYYLGAVILFYAGFICVCGVKAELNETFSAHNLINELTTSTDNHGVVFKPSPPSVTVSIDGLSVHVSWNPVSGATGYQLAYASSFLAGQHGRIDMGTQTNFNVTLWDGAAFYVAVQACNERGCSAYSNIEYFILSAAIRLNDMENICLPFFYGADSFSPLPVHGVEKFEFAVDGQGKSHLLYCSEGSSGILYRFLLSGGVQWSAPETIRAEWDGRSGYFDAANFSMDVDPFGIPHIVFGEAGDLFHGVRDNNDAWRIINKTPGADSVAGRINAVHISRDGEIGILTTRDDTDSGGYTSSDTVFISGYSADALKRTFVSLEDGYIRDLDIVYRLSGKPLFVLAQEQQGGWGLLKTVVRQGMGGWSEKILRRQWGICPTPVKIDMDMSMHILAGDYRIHMRDGEDDPVDIYHVGYCCGKKDFAVIGDDIYVLYSLSDRVVLMRSSGGETHSLIVEFPYGEPDRAFGAVGIAFSDDEIFLCYRDSYHVFKLKKYPLAGLVSCFDHLSE